jgi:hypothetical protein
MKKKITILMVVVFLMNQSTGFTHEKTTQSDVTTILKSNPRGTIFNVSLEVNVKRIGSVRFFLLVNSLENTSKILMAEKVIRGVNQWVWIRGSKKVIWKDNLISAGYTIEALQIPEGQSVEMEVRNLSIEPDEDGDLLPNQLEIKLGTSPSYRDSDMDTMDDMWEVENGCNPLLNDGLLDPDMDCFTNQEEFWSATDPRNCSSYPGKPANPKSSESTKAILRYLALLPSHKEKRVLIGQHLTNPSVEYKEYVENLWKQTGKWVGLLALQYDDLNQINVVNSYVIEYWKRGGLIKIKYSLDNPWTGKGRNDRPKKGEFNYIDIPGLLDPRNSRTKGQIESNQKAHEKYRSILDLLAEGLNDLQKQNITILWRPISEMNGAWFWWGKSSREDYIALWQDMFHYLTTTKGLNNLIWVYESDSSVHMLNPSDYYYPGDDYVDVMGHNFYNNTWELPFDANQLYRNYPKVYAFPQAGAGDNKDGMWDNMIFVDGIINRFSRCSFFAAWNSYSIQGGKVRVKRAIVDNQNAKQLMDHPWIVTREEIEREDIPWKLEK